MQRPRLSIDIHPDLGKNPARDEASTLGLRSDNRARWLKFADCALHPHGATEEDIAELTNLARDEQESIKILGLPHIWVGRTIARLHRSQVCPGDDAVIGLATAAHPHAKA